MTDLAVLETVIRSKIGEFIHNTQIHRDQLTVRIMPERLKSIITILKEDDHLYFDELIDLCGVDYQEYGLSEWATQDATSRGFERAAARKEKIRALPPMPARFAVVYHLLSIKHNHRVRLKAFLNGESPIIDSVVGIWPAANWFEREAFDLFGIFFDGHPDLRRILTDYGFVGYPFRKDFPLIGNVEMRYDAAAGRVIYDKVSIEPRTLVPRIIRQDNRYIDPQAPSSTEGKTT